MTDNDKKATCRIKGCSGTIDTTKRVPLKTGCAGASCAHPCDTCGRLHWSGDGGLVFNRSGHAIFKDRSSKRPVVIIYPCAKGPKGKKHTYFVLYSQADRGHLSGSNRFSIKNPARAKLFNSPEEAADKANALGFNVEEVED